ncbi:MAG TPA: VOC family protein [Caulobacteraceae bacterium]|nr:VOC family protein [Caulobacteraceae bacterium]HUO11194.1 VOC family protein [Caulobacteraceae bacterium]
MQLAKPRIDFGLSTNNLEPMLAFWQGEVGLPFDHLLKIRRGQDQHRHDAHGSVIKINHLADPLPEGPPSGYRELYYAKEGVTEPRALIDPDGNRVTLAPPGWRGIGQIGVRLAVRDVAAHRRFYTEAFGLSEEPWEGGAAFRAGESLLIVEPGDDAPVEGARAAGKGWSYITFQIFKVDREHAFVLAHGGREALAPVTLGETARISLVEDPDGNRIELSQRASIVGSLAP